MTLVCSTAFGQDEIPTPASPTSTSTSLEESAGSQPWKAAQRLEFFRASNLIGKGTQDNKGEKVGEIKDVVFNQQGEIFALVDVGSSRWAAVPLQVLRMRSAKGDERLVLETSKQAVSSGPLATKDQWGALNNPSFTQGIYSYFKVQSPTSTATGGSSGIGGSNSRTRL